MSFYRFSRQQAYLQSPRSQGRSRLTPQLHRVIDIVIDYGCATYMLFSAC